LASRCPAIFLTAGAALVALAIVGACARAEAPAAPRDYAIGEVPLDAVQIDQGFWSKRMDVNRTVTIPHIMAENERTGRIENFARAAHEASGPYEGRRFNDSDVYKTIEAASYALAKHPDPELDAKIGRIITLIAAAQQPDGYLYPARTIDPAHPVAGAGPERWVNLNGSHELYNVGHLYEAAVAYYEATGKRTLLDVAIKNANLVAATFGPQGRKAVPGHEEIEIGLVKLYRVTHDERYLALAKFFLDQRGHPHDTQPYPSDSPFAIYNGRPYMQDDVPVTDQRKAEGHAVRAMYLYSGMSDVAALDGDAAYAAALDRIWNDVVSKRLYLTGGLGARDTVEAFGDDYELPNRTAYTETCASVGGVLWNQRMFLREGDAKYLDVVERTLYNGFLSGVSLAGDTFFYQNPLASDGTVARTAYFEVACCPSNLARLMGQLPSLIYARKHDELYVNQFVASHATVDLGGRSVMVAQQTGYPWDGVVTIRFAPDQPTAFTLHVRIPGWARNAPVASDLYRFAGAAPAAAESQPALSVNGQPVALDVAHGFASIRRTWAPGDTVRLDLPMPVRRVVANPGVAADEGRLAIERGPIVYALEGVDNGGKVSDLTLAAGAALGHEFKPEMLGGVEIVTGTAARGAKAASFTAIPYYAWANRGKSEMEVWLKDKE
jgi:hypothetical protein